MSGYTDGFVITLPKDKIEDYRKMAEIGMKIWLEHGAVDFKECIGEDLEAKECCGSFLSALKVGPEETVVFSWITFQSRDHRDEVNAKVMKDPRIAGMCNSEDMPFDPQRMLYGGFEILVSS